MQRRSNAMAGCVRFPVSDPHWPSSGEGGLVVKLVVVNPFDFDDPANPEVCVGAQVFDVLTEVLVGDDWRPVPRHRGEYASPDDVAREQAAIAEWGRYHYPGAGEGGVEAQLSRGYLASIVLGSTGWSGHNADEGSWVCRFDDLTDAGQALYRQIKALYPDAQLHLLTFLDT